MEETGNRTRANVYISLFVVTLPMRGKFALIALAAAILLTIPLVSAATEPKPASYQQYAESSFVNLHTGDVNVDVPVLTIPGRNGMDYPILLKYHSGIQVGQEASPVGLGWELSVGSITRDVVGVPDDWCGSCVTSPSDKNYANRHKQPIPDPYPAQALGSQIGASLALSMVGMMIAPPVSGAMLAKSLASSAATTGMNGLMNNPEFPDYYNGNGPNSYNAKKLDGFSWREMGISGEEGHDYNSPDVYTLSGDYATGRLMLLEPKNTDDNLVLHLQKAGGHSTNIEDNADCLNDDTHAQNCRDTYYSYAERTSDDKGRYTRLNVIGPDGTKYVYEPTEWFVSSTGGDAGASESEFVRRQESNDGDSCNDDSRKYLKTDFKWKYATEFGLKQIISYDGDGSDSRGSYITFTYDEDPRVFHHRGPYDPAQCVTGPDGRKAWSESYKKYSYIQRIETPTHYAIFSYADDRHDSKEYAGSDHPKRLTEIALYYKGFNGDVLMEKRQFYYDWSLMYGAPDSDSGFGKLTLTSIGVYRGDNGNNGYWWGSYDFDYANDAVHGSGANPDWNMHKRDRWGYYCGNCVEGDYNLDGADPATKGLIPEAWSLTDIAWPTGGTTEFFYESDRYTKLNSWYPNAVPALGMEEQDTHYGGGIRAERVKNCDGLGSCFTTKYIYSQYGFDLSEMDGYNNPGTFGASSGVATNEPMPYAYSHVKDDRLFFGSPQSGAYVGYGYVTEVSGFDDVNQKAPFGYITHNFTTAWDYPNTGGVQADSTFQVDGKNLGMSSSQQYGVGEGMDGKLMISAHECPQLWVVPDNTELDVMFWCYGTPCGLYGDIHVDQPQYECGYEGTDYCWSMRSDWVNEGQYGPIEYTQFWVDNDNVEYFEETHDENIDTCCPDVDGDHICDIMEVPPERRFGGTKDNDSMRGLEVKTIYYGSDLPPSKQVVREYSLYEEENPAGLLDVYSEWVKLDSESVKEYGVESTTTYEYDKQSALAGAPFQSTTTGTAGVNRIETTTFAFEQYPDMLEVEPDNFHHLYSPVYETNAYQNSISSSNKWSTSSMTYAKYSNYPDETPNWGSGIIFRPRYQYEWQRNDSVILPYLVKEHYAYDDYGHLTQYKDANQHPVKIWFKDNDYPCGESVDASDLHFDLPTCEENALGHRTKYRYYDTGLLERMIDPNERPTVYAYDHMRRLKYYAPPEPNGNPSGYSTKIFWYGMFWETGNPLSMSNLNYANVSNLIKYSPQSSLRKWANTTTEYDGLGRNIRNVLVDGNGPNIWEETTFNPLSKPEREYLSHLETSPLDPSRSILSVYENNSLGAIQYTVPMGMTPSWTYAENLPEQIETSSGFLDSDESTFTSTRIGYRLVSCDLSGSGFGYGFVYDGDSSTDPVLFRCTADKTDYVMFVRGRNYLITTTHYLGTGSITLTVSDRYIGKGAERTEHSYGGANDYRMVLSVDPSGNVSYITFDKFGNQYKVGRVQDVADSSYDSTTTYSHDILGRKTGVTSPNGEGITYYYDRFGRLIKVISSDVGTILFERDWEGNILSRNRNGQVTTYTYDAINRLLVENFPGTANDIYYTYDEADISSPTWLVGRLHFANTPAQITEYGYTTRAEITMKKMFFHGQCRNAQFQFDFGCPDIDGDGAVTATDQNLVTALLARLTGPSDSVSSSDYDYNPFLDFNRDGSVTYAEAQTFYAAMNENGLRTKTYVFKFVYDDQGHRNQTHYPSAFQWEPDYQELVWKNEYDKFQNLYLATLAAPYKTINYGYTPDGLLASETMSNGVSTSLTYNARNLLETNQVEKSGIPVFQEAYDYDLAGNIASLYVGNAVGVEKAADYTYNPLDELTGVDSHTVNYRGYNQDYYGADLSYTYDLAGNRQSKNGVSYSYDPSHLNRLLTDDSCSYSYNSNGSVTSKTCGSISTNFNYDYNGRLSKVVHGDGSCELFEYDENGNRVKKTSQSAGSCDLTLATLYAYDGNTLIEEYGPLSVSDITC